MATPTPVEQTTSDIQSLQSDLNSLQNDVRLARLRDEIEDLETNTNGLEQRVRDIRARGYVFDRQLEARTTDMKSRWAAIRVQVLDQINQQCTLLDIDARGVETLVQAASARANIPQTAGPIVAQARSALSSLQSKVSSAENSIRGSYNTYQQEVSELQNHLKEIEWMLQQLDEAAFKLLPTEGGVMAVEAVWVKDGKEDKDDPKGVLYLSDQRLLFEQKQQVATKKILFITTESQKVQKLLVEVPNTLLDTVSATKQGLFNHEDHIELTFASGAPFYRLHFHLDGQDCNRWQGLLGQAQSHAFDQDRAVALNSTDLERVKAAPSQCPSCGGAIHQPVLRGMDSLKCEYCGFVIRL